MNPILLDDTKPLATLATDRSLGLGMLSETMSAVVHEVANGEYTAEIVYPVFGRRFNQLHAGGIVKMKPNETSSLQMFRIKTISKPLNGKVTLYLNHISYDLAKAVVLPCQSTGAMGAVAAMRDSLVSAASYPFTIQTDKSGGGKFAVSVPKSLRACIGGEQGSFLDLYGGEIEWDNLAVKLWGHRGADNGVTIRYAKNLTGLKFEESIDTTYTAVLPYATYTAADGQTTSTVVGALHTIINEDEPRVFALDLSSNFTGEGEAPTAATLDNLCDAYIEANDLASIKISADVNFIALWQTEEYKEFAPLERVSLFDTVHVKHPGLGITLTARVTETEYDCLHERYRKIHLGRIKASLASAIVTQQAETKQQKQDMTTWWQDALKKNTDTMNGVNGGYKYVVTDEQGRVIEEYWMDSPSIETAVNVRRENFNGIAYSHNGINGPFVSAWLMDGSFTAELMQTLVLRAQQIQSGILSISDGQGNETLYVNVDTGEVRIKANSISTVAGETFAGVNLVAATRYYKRSPSNVDPDGAEPCYLGEDFYLSYNQFLHVPGSTVEPEGWTTTCPPYADGYYLWERIRYEYEDGSYTWSNATCIDWFTTLGTNINYQASTIRSEIAQTDSSIRAAVEAKEISLKDYADGVGRTQQNYTNSKVAEIDIEIDHITQTVAQKETDLQAYADDVGASERQYTNSQVSQINQTIDGISLTVEQKETELKAYADAIGEDQESYTDDKVAAINISLDAITSTVASNATAAKNYTDGKVADERTYTNSKVSEINQSLDGISATVTQKEQEVKNYADGIVEDLEDSTSERFAGINLSLDNITSTITANATTAKKYTDDKVSEEHTYSSGQVSRIDQSLTGISATISSKETEIKEYADGLASDLEESTSDKFAEIDLSLEEMSSTISSNAKTAKEYTDGEVSKEHTYSSGQVSQINQTLTGISATITSKESELKKYTDDAVTEQEEYTDEQIAAVNVSLGEINSTISSKETSLKSYADDVGTTQKEYTNSKIAIVNQTLDSITQTVAANKTEAHQYADGAVSTYSQTVSSQLSQMTDQINLKVSQSDFDSEIDSLGEEINSARSEAASALNLQVDQITAEVSRVETKVDENGQAIENLEYTKLYIKEDGVYVENSDSGVLQTVITGSGMQVLRPEDENLTEIMMEVSTNRVFLKNPMIAGRQIHAIGGFEMRVEKWSHPTRQESGVGFFVIDHHNSI